MDPNKPDPQSDPTTTIPSAVDKPPKETPIIATGSSEPKTETTPPKDDQPLAKADPEPPAPPVAPSTNGNTPAFPNGKNAHKTTPNGDPSLNTPPSTTSPETDTPPDPTPAGGDHPEIAKPGNNLLLGGILIAVLLLVAGGAFVLYQNRQNIPEPTPLPAEVVEYENPFEGVAEDASGSADTDNPFATDSGYVNPFQQFEEATPPPVPSTSSGQADSQTYRNPFE